MYAKDYSNANLIEEVKWNRYKYEGHQVGRGDNGCHQHDDDERMLAIARQHAGSHNSYELTITNILAKKRPGKLSLGAYNTYINYMLKDSDPVLKVYHLLSFVL